MSTAKRQSPRTEVPVLRDGGYVHKAASFPRRPGVTAVMGTWSGGVWQRSTPFHLTQHRANKTVGIWRVVGVDLLARASRSPLLLVEPVREGGTFLEGDIVTFGDAAFSALELSNTTLTIEAYASVEVGPDRIHGVACFEGGRVSKIVLFHSHEDTLPSAARYDVFWRDQRFSMALAHHPSEPVELYINSAPKVTLGRLLNTLQPVRGFILGSGQEMLFHTPRGTKGRFRQETRETFEPLVSVKEGSVRVILGHAQPERIPLFVRPEDPMRLFVEAMAAISQRNERRLLGLLGKRVFSVNKLIDRLREVALASSEGGAVTIKGGGFGEFVVDFEAYNWLTEIVARPERELCRTGELYAADSHRNWCKVLVDSGAREDWTLRFESKLRNKVKSLMFSHARVIFTTRVPEDLSGGAGTLRDIEPA